MKLVNPDFLGFTIDYEFIGIELVCKKFKDPYTGNLYEKTGCYACRYLNISHWTRISCSKKYNIEHIPVRKDEETGEIMENCPEYSSTRDRYGRSGCSSCKHKYYGSRRAKCRLKHMVREEIIRM